MYQGPNDLTNADYNGLVMFAKTQINPILAKYSPRVAHEDALHLAIRSFNNGQFDGKINADHFNVLVNAMEQQPVQVIVPERNLALPENQVMAKSKEKAPKPEKEKTIPQRVLKDLGVDPRKVPFMKSHAPHLIKKPGQGIILKKKAAEDGAPNEYLVDFLSYVDQLPTKDFDVIRKFVGRWKQSKVLVKEFLQGAIKDAGIDPEYAQKVADDFKIAAVTMDRLESLYDMISKFDMDKIKTHFEPLTDLVKKVQEKGSQQSAPAPEPVTGPGSVEESVSEKTEI
jgi:hypothetical protein